MGKAPSPHEQGPSIEPGPIRSAGITPAAQIDPGIIPTLAE
jgi:hypothetical protein